jgi:DNA helicase-2/ATP-dependent DNA helicase PcrA
MKLSDEQREAIHSAEHLCLASCPGSGKTRTVVAKILRCLDDVRDTSRRIGCITYTNAAVNEIEGRLRVLGSRDDESFVEISTIHSFCLTHYLRPYYHLLAEFKDGFEVFAPDSDGWSSLIDSLIRRHRLDRRRADDFGSIERATDGFVRCPADLSVAAAEDFIRYCDEHGLIAMSDIVYHAYRLTTVHPSISRGIASRFAWLLIDEFQDTTAVQVELFKAIARHDRTLFFLVGDPNQSIMSFAGGHPRLMVEFAEHIGARTDLTLSGNYRCSSRIVIHAEMLCPCDPSMRAEGVYRGFPVDPEHVHAANQVEAVFEHFIPAVESLSIPFGEAAILAPWWTTLYQVARELRLRGIPMIGPGARPYRRAHEFSRFAEHACAYIEEQSPEHIRTTQKALFLLIGNLSGATDWRIYSYSGKKMLFRILRRLKQLAEEHPAAVEWLTAAAAETNAALLAEDLIPSDKQTVLVESAQGMIADMQRNGVDTANLALSDIGLFAQPSRCLNLLTLHSAKGREFDAVAMIDLHEGRIPNFRATTQEEFDEARRLFYVGITRARKLLMYCTDSSDYRNRPSRFLESDGIGIV